MLILRVSLLAGLALTLFAAFPWPGLTPYPRASGATPITVTSTDDNGPGSLRQVLLDATPGSTIDFGVTGTITLTSGYVEIDTSLTISGPGSDSLVISGNNNNQVLYVSAGPATVSGVTITDGGLGGIEIASTGDLTLEDAVVRDNKNPGAGAGIFNNGILKVNNSAISGNTTLGDGRAGGGIFNGSTGTITVTNSTINGNHATSEGGGIENSGGTATITNSTITGNTAASEFYGGGGIFSGGPLVLMNTTIADNAATLNGGGVFNYSGSLQLRNSIIAGNSAGNSSPDCRGSLTSQGHNLIGDLAACEFTSVEGDITGQDPLLAPLADNGGPTETHALLPGSPAINAGDDDACPPADQRGTARPVGPHCDIGAVERSAGGKQGDVNCDDAVTAVDALFILRNVAQIPPPAECLAAAGDVNCDGGKTAVDALGVLRYVAGLPVNQNEPCANVGAPV